MTETLSPVDSGAPRRLLHRRSIECYGYQRDDGLWDIEARMVDTKTYGFANHDRGRIEPGEPLHGMWLRVTCDDDLTIVDAQAVTEHGPFRQCPDIAPAYDRLKGLQIGKGFDRAIRSLFDGAAGCTHLRELLRPIATTAFQTIFPAREKKRREQAADHKPGILDSCYALRSDGEVVQREWPAFYTGPEAHPETPAANTLDKGMETPDS